MQPTFYAVIPATVRYSKKVCDGAKLLYGEITALCNQSGYCWAEIAYFADLYDRSERTISDWIKQLSEAGFIAISFVGSKRKVAIKEAKADGEKPLKGRRKLPGGVEENFQGGRRKLPGGVEENFYPYNNTINTTSNNSLAGKPQKEKKPIQKMVAAFEEEHKKHFQKSGQWIGYVWQAKDFAALSKLYDLFGLRISKRGAAATDEKICEAWASFLETVAKKDAFTLQNSFTPARLNSNFNTIVQKLSSNGNSKQPIPDKAAKRAGAISDLIAHVAQHGI